MAVERITSLAKHLNPSSGLNKMLVSRLSIDMGAALPHPESRAFGEKKSALLRASCGAEKADG